MSSVSKARHIVGAWRVLEMFSPTSVPKVTKGRCEDPSLLWEPGERFPWDPEHYCQHWLKPGHCWEHTLYLGHFDLEGMYDALHRVFPPVPTTHDERCSGASAVLKLSVNQFGTPDPNDLVLSMCAWGLGVLARQRGGSFDLSQEAFEQTCSVLKRNLESFFLEQFAEQEVPVLDAETLLRINVGIQKWLGLDLCEGLKLRPALVSSRQISLERADSGASKQADDSTFLNSFLIDDLDAVFQSVRRRGATGPLGLYLNAPLDHQYKIDVRARSHRELLDLLSPENMPLGRWPTNPKHPLATNQQLAVNLAMQSREEGVPLFSINGPPGTGKTTLLRDLIAALVTQRAQAIADLSRPSHGFTGEKFEWTSDGFDRRVHELHPRLCGFEVLIASSNNAAVENISHELPDLDSLGEEFSQAQYFAKFATNLLGASKKKNAQGWGMVSARLGNKSNRTQFATDIWFRPNYKKTSEPANLQEWFQRLTRGGRPVRRSWKEAVARFRRREQEVERLLRKASRAQRELDRDAQIEALLFEQVRLERARTDKQGEHFERCRDEEASLHQMRVQESHCKGAIEARRQYAEHKPGLMESVWTFGKSHRSWFEHDQVLEQAHRNAESLYADAKAQYDSARSAQLSAKAQLDALDAQYDEVSEELGRYGRALEAMAEDWGRALPDTAWFEDEEHRASVAPWLSPELCKARSELFLAALELHVDFLEHNASRMVDNLRAAMDVVSGKAPAQLEQSSRLAAWQSFFLVVPTVSTTFASAGRMLKGIGPESLGWLLVDEAGQATPQAVAGAMWRCKMAVVVGDPIQLTPVVTLPAKAEGEICDALGCPDWARPRRSSVQAIADGRNRWGTAFSDGDDEPRWVGAPLLVHRRCLEPMFSICNAIAYDNAMLHGCRGRAKRYPDLPESTWIDIKAHALGDSHALVNDVLFCKELVVALARRHGVPQKDVIIITPFREMAAALRRKMPDPNQRCGSVHTAQGQEAPIVVLALGGNPKRPGARVWATSTPNLFNVAVSRAKDQLYVVGDRSAWKGLRYMDLIAMELGTVGPSRFLEMVYKIDDGIVDTASTIQALPPGS